MKVVASIEARMASSRLPGKVLAPINGVPALTRMVRRLSRCARIDGVVLATSVDPADDALASWARAEGVPCYRGSHDDVLGRVVGAHQSMGSDVVVELAGDMPLLDPDVVDRAVTVFEAEDCDVVTTTVQPSYPVGIDAQVFRLADLEAVSTRVFDPAVREHVSLYFYRHPELFRTVHLAASGPCNDPGLRLVMDYPEDLKLIEEIYRRLEPAYGDAFGLEEIVGLLLAEPQLRRINGHCKERVAR